MTSSEKELLIAAAGDLIGHRAALAQLEDLLGEVEVLDWLVVPHMAVSPEAGLQSAVEVLAVRPSSVLYWYFRDQPGDEASPGLLSGARTVPLSVVTEVLLQTSLSPDPERELPTQVSLRLELATVNEVSLQPIFCGEECEGTHGQVGEFSQTTLLFGGESEDIGDELIQQVIAVGKTLSALVG